MSWVRHVLALSLLVLAHAGTSWAQGDETRPATTTFWGDTGLWFVPTAEILPPGALSFSLQRTESDFRQGNTNVSSWPVTGAVGAPRVELFGVLRVVTRIDRDTSPLLFTNVANETGGLVNEYPAVHDSWTGNQLGDLYVGGKLNLLSQERLQPFALAIRGTAKLPTADRDTGAGTGKVDGFVDLIGSREVGSMELTGFGGIALRGDPDDVDLSDGIRWGAGAAFPTRRSIRATAEVFGEWMFDRAVSAPQGILVGVDGSLSPATSRLTDSVNASVGLTWQHPSGVLLGAALSYQFNLETEDGAGTPRNTSGDALAVQFRIGFHRGVKLFVPPPALAAAPPPTEAAPPPPSSTPAPTPAAPAANRAPTIRVICEPCSVRTGETATLRAEALDPDGDPLQFQWSATGGTLADTRGASTTWRAETAPGLITFTVVAEDGRGARVSDTVTIEVTDSEDVDFEDVLFDFDSSRLREDMLPRLEPVIAAMIQRPRVRLVIEGHTCNVGTAEYNLALGERRASTVLEYLAGRGIDTSRMSTLSYGEEQPAHDNSHGSTRRLNRRTELVLRLNDTETR